MSIFDLPDDPGVRCGSPHPRNPKITCVRMGGKCLIDWHLGIVGPTGHREYIQWGTAHDDYKKQASVLSG